MAVTETTAYNPGKFEIPASSLNWKQLSPAHSAKWEEDTQGDIRTTQRDGMGREEG